MKFVYILSKKLNSFQQVDPIMLNTIVNINCIFLLLSDYQFLLFHTVTPGENNFIAKVIILPDLSFP